MTEKQGKEQVVNIFATSTCEYYLHPQIFIFGDICTSANIGFGHDEYSRIFVGGYIAALGPIYAPYIDSNISLIRRISVM